MTVNTQELRELLAGLPTEPGCKHLAVPYSPKRIGFGHSGGPAWFLASSGSCTGPGEVLQYLRSMSELLNALPALLDEIDVLRGERAVLADILRDALGPLRVDLLNAEADGDCEDSQGLRAIIDRAEAALNPPAPPQVETA